METTPHTTQESTSALPAVQVPTQYAPVNGKSIAYRSIGHGRPMVLCNRFRGILDSWDPAFLDELAQQFHIIIFDYSGVGLSSGELAANIATVAGDVKDLITFFGFEQVIIGGWSYGGFVAQTFSTHYPHLITHTILLGTNPPGRNEHPTEPLFFERALNVSNDLDDEIVLFFEPLSKASCQAAQRSHDRIGERKTDTDIPVPEQTWPQYMAGGADFGLDLFNSRQKLGTLTTPILAISGDHDLVFPIENWYALSRQLPNLQLIMLPRTGHGPQQQHPYLTAHYIFDFISHAQAPDHDE